MKKIIKINLFIFGFLFILGSCQKEDFVEINPDVKVKAKLSVNNLVLNENTAQDNVLTISWTEPDFGFEAAPTYYVLLDVAGGDFSNPQIFSAGNALSKVFKGEELNNALLSLGIATDTPIGVAFKVRAQLSKYKVFDSAPLTLTVTAYSSILDLSTEWGIVGSATPGGWGSPDIPDLPFYKTATTGILVAYVTLRNGEIKFRKNNDWSVNVGDDGLDGTLEPNGANIPVTEGTYKITFDTVNMTYTIEAYSWGIVGDATPNGWSGPDLQFTFNPYNNDWKAAVTLTTGQIKFRLNNDWTVNYGDDGADGTLEAGGANIDIIAGHYIITFDPENMTYSIDAADLWGVVGDATPNSWSGPDAKFLPDFGLNPGKWYLNGITLTNGEIKIRQNDDWTVNYGDDGNDGTLEPNGANIPVTAGTYNIELDFSVSPPTIRILAWQ